MEKIKKVMRVDFNNDENKEDLAVSKIELFRAADTERETASVQISRYLSQIHDVTFYKGWNDQVYPQFLIEYDRVS